MMNSVKKISRASAKRATMEGLAAILLFALIGCGAQQSAPATTIPVPVQGSSFQGRVYGGQSPITGATVQLYAASTSGYGVPYNYAAGTSLLGNNAVTTDGGGFFNIGGDYTCPSASTLVYLVAYGGNPGLGVGMNNASIAGMAALGPCGNLSASTFISLNELTTVASVWALSPFMSSIVGIGTSGPTSTSTGNPQGLINAFASVNKVVNIASGTVGGPALPSGAILPVQKIYLLADILAACINSSGNTGPASPCGMLFTYATVNGVTPSDTITAAMNIAQHPNQNVVQLATLAGRTPPFPNTAGIPSDFSIVISYVGGGLSAPKGVATDTAGNVWLANSGNNTVTKLDAAGVTSTDPSGFLSGVNGFMAASLSTPSAVAIDASGNAWIANTGASSSVTKLTSDGSTQTVYTGGGLSTPRSLSIDAFSNIWVANYGNSTLSRVSSSGVVSNYASSGIAAPTAIAIDPK
jgi:streptogramin lyase